jgi:hypothetical protein
MTPIPESLRRVFVRHEFDALDLQRDADVIIPEVLRYGSWDEIRWLFATYGFERIRSWMREDVETRMSLPPAVQALWTLVLLGEVVPPSGDSALRRGKRREVPPDEVPDWLREQFEETADD